MKAKKTLLFFVAFAPIILIATYFATNLVLSLFAPQIRDAQIDTSAYIVANFVLITPFSCVAIILLLTERKRNHANQA